MQDKRKPAHTHFYTLQWLQVLILKFFLPDEAHQSAIIYYIPTINMV